MDTRNEHEAMSEEMVRLQTRLSLFESMMDEALAAENLRLKVENREQKEKIELLESNLIQAMTGQQPEDFSSE